MRIFIKRFIKTFCLFIFAAIMKAQGFEFLKMCNIFNGFFGYEYFLYIFAVQN